MQSNVRAAGEDINIRAMAKEVIRPHTAIVATEAGKPIATPVAEKAIPRRAALLFAQNAAVQG